MVRGSHLHVPAPAHRFARSGVSTDSPAIGSAVLLGVFLLLAAASVASAQGTASADAGVTSPAAMTSSESPGADAADHEVSSRGFWWKLGQTTPAGAAAPGERYGNWWKQLRGGYQRSINEGSFEVFVSGYAWHPPTSYDEANRDDLNEKAWGTGLSRTISDSGTRQNGVYLFVSEDSHNDPQVMWGYLWLARTPPKAGLRLGAGYTLMLIQRDEYGYVPVPFATPLFTLDTGPVQTVVSYVPKYDVWYVFGRITIRGQKARVASSTR